MNTSVKCRFCHKEIPRASAYKIGKSSYYCDEECFKQSEDKRLKNKNKYEPAENTYRRNLTDYIQSLYLDEGYDKREINWTLICSQIKNLIEQNKYKYTGILLTLKYMKEIKELNLFDDNFNGSILNLVPFYFEETKQNYMETKRIKDEVENFDFKENIIVIHKSIKKEKKYKEIDMSSLKEDEDE